MDVRSSVIEAEKRIRPHIRETPVEESIWLSEVTGGEVFLKLENLQITNSFKLRGAANKLLSLSDEESSRGIVTASSGNHGSAIAYLLRRFGWPGTIYVPETVSRAKVGALEQYGADLKFHGQDGIETENFARQIAEEKGMTYVSPYNDEKIIGGQGTIALELEGQLGEIDAVVVPVGGGGLIAGVAGYLKSLDPSIDIVGCQPRNSKVMYESLAAGKILDLPSEPTLADGTAGGIEVDSLTFTVCQETIDEMLLIEEEEIEDSIRQVLKRHHLLIEGAAALSVAALLRDVERFAGKKVVLVLSGARISLDVLRELL